MLEFRGLGKYDNSKNPFSANTILKTYLSYISDVNY